MTPEIAAWLLLGAGLGSGALALNALRPSKVNPVVLVGSFFASWLTNELALHLLLTLTLTTAGLIAAGALEHPAGIAGLAVMACAAIGVGAIARRGIATTRAVAHVREAPGGEATPGVPLSRSVVALPILRFGIQRQRHVRWTEPGERPLHVDIFTPKGAAGGGLRPALIQIHGGGWIIGDKREQGLPLVHHMARQGWVVFNVNYRLSPEATFPDHLVDLKRALVWVRRHAGRYGVDPDFIAVTGGSAGAHLAALLALTAEDPSLQPGFEDADTRVQAAVTFYGVYDFTDRLRLMGRPFFSQLLEPLVMKKRLREHAESFRAASPLDRVHAQAPPFLIIHGTHDTLAPVQYARLFAEILRAASRQPVELIELLGAQHAFDVFHSPRTDRTIEAAERFLTASWRRRHEARRG